MVNVKNLAEKFWFDYTEAFRYNNTKSKNLGSVWDKGSLSNNLQEVANQCKNMKSIGYIVATCSPVTRAHLALAKQASNDLNLNKVIFILWPFYYIEGFHKMSLDAWVKEQQHLPWENRFELLTLAIRDIGDERFAVLYESKQWYEESKSNFDSNVPLSAFWTGTWYVIRKFQWFVKLYSNPEVEFTFVCGMDQYNPNINSLIYSEGASQVWKDYSIAQQLAIHNVYTVPRLMDNTEAIEEFSQPFGCRHKIIIIIFNTPSACGGVRSGAIYRNYGIRKNFP